MKQQTAVEWFQSQIINIVNGNCELSEIEIFEKAKQMEQDQIQDAFYFGVDVDSFNVISPYKEAEKYYQKTFVNENV